MYEEWVRSGDIGESRRIMEEQWSCFVWQGSHDDRSEGVSSSVSRPEVVEEHDTVHNTENDIAL
jgi:hypothetical protein